MANATNQMVVHPGTGEVIDQLESQPPEVLADAWLAITEHKRQYDEFAKLVEAELKRRLAMRNRDQDTFGPFRVQAKTQWRSQWDVDELEQVLRELIDDGTVRASEVVDVITTPQPEVSASAANSLLRKLSGAAETAVKACRTWQQQKAKKLLVERLDTAAGEPNQPDQ